MASFDAFDVVVNRFKDRLNGRNGSKESDLSDRFTNYGQDLSHTLWDSVHKFSFRLLNGNDYVKIYFFELGR